MKKPTLKKRLKRHDSMVAPSTNSLGISKMPDSPKCSTKLKSPEMWGKGKLFLTVLKILFFVIVAMITSRTVTMKKMASFSSIEGDNSTRDSFVSDCSSLNVSGEEMQDMQADFDSVIQVSQEANSDHNNRFSFGDIDTSDGVIEKDENCNGEGSSKEHRVCRREKVKSKFKKLLPKKIRRSMKRRSSSKCEKAAGSMEEVNFEMKDYNNELDDKKENITSVTASESCKPIKSDSEESAVEAKPQRPTDRKTLILDYWFNSFIVLAGLVEGQSLAAVLTVAWCLIMKLVARMHRKK